MALPANSREVQTEQLPGDFARHAKTGAPYVASPTETRQRQGKRAELLAQCDARGIDLAAIAAERGLAGPQKITVPTLRVILGPEPRKVLYGRPSSLGKQIENMTNLQKWSERAVALGCYLDFRAAGEHGVTPNLFATIDELVDEQLNLDDPDARTILDTIAVQAKRAAQAHIAADRGTHTHALTEDSDNERDWIERARSGEDLGIPIEAQHALVAAWEQMLVDEAIEILAVETIVVDDRWRQAGTLDRIARLTRDRPFTLPGGEIVTLAAGTVVVLDVKTGQLRVGRDGHPDYWHGYAVQVASYAQSVPYDTETDTRGAWEYPIDQQWAIIAHLDVLAALEGEARCRLVLVDLELGRAAGELCVAAREWEKARCVFSLITDDGVAVPVEIATEPDARPPAASGSVATHEEGVAIDSPIVDDVGVPATLSTRFATSVVGVSFTPGYPRNVLALAVGQHLGLARNPDNPHDANAIAVLDGAIMIGHLKATVAATLAPRLDQGEKWSAVVDEVRIDPEYPDRPGVTIECRRVAPSAAGATSPPSTSASIATEEPCVSTSPPAVNVDFATSESCEPPSTGGTSTGPTATPTTSPTPTSTSTASSSSSTTVARREQLRARFYALAPPDQQRFYALAIDPGNLDAIEAGLNLVDPFQHVEPVTRPEHSPAPAPRDNEGGACSSTALAQLLDEIAASDARAVVNAWHVESLAGDESWDPRLRPTVRRFEVLRAAFALAVATDGDDQCARMLIELAGPHHHVAAPIGRCLATFDADAARRLMALALAFGNRLTLMFDDSGSPQLVGDVAAVLAAA